MTGEQFMTLRRAVHRHRREVAQRLGYTYSMIEKMERNERRIPPDVAQAFRAFIRECLEAQEADEAATDSLLRRFTA